MKRGDEKLHGGVEASLNSICHYLDITGEDRRLIVASALIIITTLTKKQRDMSRYVTPPEIPVETPEKDNDPEDEWEELESILREQEEAARGSRHYKLDYIEARKAEEERRKREKLHKWRIKIYGGKPEGNPEEDFFWNEPFLATLAAHPVTITLEDTRDAKGRRCYWDKYTEQWRLCSGSVEGPRDTREGHPAAGETTVPWRP